MTDNNINIISIVPIRSYSNLNVKKRQIYIDNKGKTGIYRWTNIISGKSYVGSSVNLSSRFENYFNINYLKREIKNNNSKIYRALLKYEFSNFRLDILEYCDISTVIEREQWYLYNLNPKYNILKYAGSSYGFKWGKHSEVTKLKLSSNWQAHPVKVINNKTGEIKLFTSIRQAAKFIGISYSYITGCLRKNKFYIGRGYYITRNLSANK
jgi:hypothetical protein